MKTETRFDPAGEQFIDHYDMVRGHVRQEVTRRNLVSHLPSRGALDVLDFGAGDGRDGIWLAGEGDHTTLLDESSLMTKKAEERVIASNIMTRRHITRIVTGGLEQLEDDDEYDVILSHGVLMYELDDPVSQLQGLSARLRAGGILSLLTKGHEAARELVKDPEALEKFETDGEYVNRRGLPARAYRADQLEGMVRQAGLEPVARYGVRVLFDDDHRPFTELPKNELSLIMNQEIEASRDPARMERAQMLHVIARKQS